MGLDMYAFATKKYIPDTAPAEMELGGVPFAYWRKHPNLHGWMERLYRSKGGTDEFNVVKVALTEKDINDLEVAVSDGKLPDTSGFFFGESSAEDKWDDITFIRHARQALEDGLNVYYTSWW